MEVIVRLRAALGNVWLFNTGIVHIVRRPQAPAICVQLNIQGVRFATNSRVSEGTLILYTASEKDYRKYQILESELHSKLIRNT